MKTQLLSLIVVALIGFSSPAQAGGFSGKRGLKLGFSTRGGKRGRCKARAVLRFFSKQVQKTRLAGEAKVLVGEPMAPNELNRVRRLLDQAEAHNPVQVTYRKRGTKQVLKVRTADGQKITFLTSANSSAVVSRTQGRDNVELRAKVPAGSLASYLSGQLDKPAIQALETARYVRYEQYGKGGQGVITFYSAPKNRIYIPGASGLTRVEISGKASDFAKIVKGARSIANPAN